MSDSTRISLIEALKDPDDKTALARFCESYYDKLNRWARQWCYRNGLPEKKALDVADEIAQSIVVNIRDKIEQFDLSKRQLGGFRKWLRIMTERAAKDFLKKYRATGDSAVQKMLYQIPGNADLMRELDSFLYRQIAETAKEHLRRTMSEEDWQILEALGWEDGRLEKKIRQDKKKPTHAEVAAKFNKTPAAVAKIKQRAIAQLKEAIAALLRDEIEEG